MKPHGRDWEWQTDLSRSSMKIEVWWLSYSATNSSLNVGAFAKLRYVVETKTIPQRYNSMINEQSRYQSVYDGLHDWPTAHLAQWRVGFKARDKNKVWGFCILTSKFKKRGTSRALKIHAGKVWTPISLIWKLAIIWVAFAQKKRKSQAHRSHHRHLHVFHMEDSVVKRNY